MSRQRIVHAAPASCEDAAQQAAGPPRGEPYDCPAGGLRPYRQQAGGKAGVMAPILTLLPSFVGLAGTLTGGKAGVMAPI
jgi:hypothetical protein